MRELKGENELFVCENGVHSGVFSFSSYSTKYHKTHSKTGNLRIAYTQITCDTDKKIKHCYT